ncbi:TadE/TadG family type IV pilus assembly protein [Roseibium sediminis]|uniref:TadE/TadG family type IV pilus assembly protein n=1 Tax=Roseibium sediminis TaxID=1775174 RepID=UPI00123C9CB1|nr:TadE/TadG family type IV pilus assembly protein [Roseibium sediminis]
MSEIFLRLSGFKEDQRGVVAILGAFLMMLLILAVGVAVDYSRLISVKSKMINSLDGASLAAAIKYSDFGSDSEIRKAALDSYTARAGDVNIYGATLSDFKVAINKGTNEVTVNATISLPTTFMGIFGFEDMKTYLKSTATGGGQKNILDLVMCIDATGSMGFALSAVQQNALNFEKDLKKRLRELGRQIDVVRVRPIYYWDYDDPWGYAGRYWWATSYGMKASQFLELPKQNNDFKNFVNSERANGGGDIPEAGLECFNEGLRSTWYKPTESRQAVFPVVALWTDAPADSPGNWSNINQTAAGHTYPANMPRTWAGLKSAWENNNLIDQERKQFVLFGNPSQNGWSQLSTWDGYVYGGPVKAGAANMINTIADAIYKKLPPPYLSG